MRSRGVTCYAPQRRGPGAAPFLAMHGGQDKAVPIELSKLLYEAGTSGVPQNAFRRASHAFASGR